MANQKDQDSDPLEEDTSMAEESKPEKDSECSNDDDKDMTDEFSEEFIRQKKLNELKRRAFYSVLLAFRVETLSLGNKRDEIIEKLMNEWSIGQETRVSFEDNIKKNLVAYQQRVDSEVKETKKIVEVKPVTTRQPARKLTYVATNRSKWGRVYPEDLVGRRVLVKMPGEEEFEYLVIKEYNAKEGKHRLETLDLNVMWMNETLSWIDVRKVPVGDIKWRIGEDPEFETPPGLGAGQ
ncbi:unnamed protein product [Eruca vesicaria subsp. sativa]|uniref:ENT domain-containing protein n=1 Tax=Eruca vesicaria subsp. sativa TaxID=29727 RepID=A0ABC8LIL4_ERUVS|nr:unnamed protein product [Eruca vesicaria subsp. sativa]